MVWACDEEEGWEWVRQCLVFPVEGVRGKGRPRKQAENVKEDMRLKGLEASWVFNRGQWRYGLCSGPTPAQQGNFDHLYQNR